MRKKISDAKKALSLVGSASRDMKYTLALEINFESSNTVIRNVYECFRMLGEALLAKKGFESTSHSEPINELTLLKVKSPRPLNILENLRSLRRNVNYYGYNSTPEDAKQAADFAKSCFNLIKNKVLEEIRSKN